MNLYKKLNKYYVTVTTAQGKADGKIGLYKRNRPRSQTNSL